MLFSFTLFISICLFSAKVTYAFLADKKLQRNSLFKSENRSFTFINRLRFQWYRSGSICSAFSILQCSIYSTFSILQCSIYSTFSLLQCSIYSTFSILQCSIYSTFSILQCSIYSTFSLLQCSITLYFLYSKKAFPLHFLYHCHLCMKDHLKLRLQFLQIHRLINLKFINFLIEITTFGIIIKR